MYVVCSGAGRRSTQCIDGRAAALAGVAPPALAGGRARPASGPGPASLRGKWRRPVASEHVCLQCSELVGRVAGGRQLTVGSRRVCVVILLIHPPPHLCLGTLPKKPSYNSFLHTALLSPDLPSFLPSLLGLLACVFLLAPLPLPPVRQLPGGLDLREDIRRKKLLPLGHFPKGGRGGSNPNSKVLRYFFLSLICIKNWVFRGSNPFQKF